MQRKKETGQRFLWQWTVGLFVIVVLLAVIFMWFQHRDRTAAFIPDSAMTEKEIGVFNTIAQTEINTTSVEECDHIFESSLWCGVVKSVHQITKQEWEDLFPQAAFYVVRRTLYSNQHNQFPEQRHMLVAEQDGHNLSLDPGRAFEQLMEMNSVVITEENRELIGRALALMYLPNYLESEIEFFDWRAGEWSAPLRINYNYAVSVKPGIKRWQFSWVFSFYEGQLIAAQGRVVFDEEIDRQDDGLYPPPQDTLTYWKR